MAFVHTDTKDGKLCAEILKEWCLHQWNCCVSLYNIKGLQVKDALLFSKEGVKNFLKCCIDLIEKYEYTHDIIINPTGGFKGIVPYTTLVGMIFSKPIYYIFENSDVLIRLPIIPINYNEELLDKCAEKLKQIEKDTCIRSDKFWDMVDFYEREKFTSLIEEEGGLVTVSPIGLILWERYKKDFPPHLVRINKKPEDKKIDLRDDHGRDVLMRWAKRLVNNPYVEEIVNSLPFSPRTTNPIKKVCDNGFVDIVFTKTDAGYGMVIKTTGRNKKETEEIVKILMERYGF
ncbi:MAG: putative CRISPR-associated protein [Candidatus Jettenia sp.]|nr:putative CRISPR-associated protein [Candidatus Jettenia sp.]